MDSIFEDETEEVLGGEIEAYCPSARCKADTTHTITDMYEDEVRKVQCMACGEVHAYRKPRGDFAIDDATAKRAGQKRVTWDDALSRASDNDLGNTRPYSIRDAYEEGDVIHHPKFDVVFVSQLLPDNKVEVVVRGEDEPKVLVHNRGDLASRMPDISEMPVPREQKKKKRAKKPDAAPAAVVTRSKVEVEAAIVKARGAAQVRMDESQKTSDQRSQKLSAAASKKTKAAPAKAAPVAAAGKTAPAAAAKAAVPAKGKAAAPVAKKPAPAPAPAAKKPAPAPAAKKAAPAPAAKKKPAPAAAAKKKPAPAPAKKKPAPAPAVKKKPAPAPAKKKPAPAAKAKPKKK